jgi:hypothetical protein
LGIVLARGARLEAALVLAVAIAIVLGSAIATGTATLPGVTAPAPPGNELQTLIADALERAVIAEVRQSKGDGGAGADTLNLQVEARCRGWEYTLSGRALPRAHGVTFRLLTRDEIVAISCLSGHFEHFRVRVPEISAHEAIVEIELDHLECTQVADSTGGSENSLGYHGRAHIYTYQKGDDAWSLLNEQILLVN